MACFSFAVHTPARVLLAYQAHGGAEVCLVGSTTIFCWGQVLCGARTECFFARPPDYNGSQS